MGAQSVADHLLIQKRSSWCFLKKGSFEFIKIEISANTNANQHLLVFQKFSYFNAFISCASTKTGQLPIGNFTTHLKVYWNNVSIDLSTTQYT